MLGLFGANTLKGFFLTLVGAMILVPQLVNAASVYLESAESIYEVGDTFMVPVRIDPEDICINAVETIIQYDPTVLTAVDVGRGSSIFSLWIEDPIIDREAGTISLTGGIPGGYCGRVQGDPGLTNRLAEVVFTAINATNQATTSIGVESATVYAHDGRGTPVPTSVARLQLSITEDTIEGVSNEWLQIVSDDVVAPELFEVILNSDPSVEEGRYYVIFSTVDKQSGISHYEVLETDSENWGFLSWISKPSHWVVAQSPYILRDQSLRSTVQVKALDKAGNERIVTFQAPEDLQRGFTLTDLIGVIILVGIGLLGLFLIWFMIRTKKQRPAESASTTDSHDEIVNDHE